MVGLFCNGDGMIHVVNKQTGRLIFKVNPQRARIEHRDRGAACYIGIEELIGMLKRAQQDPQSFPRSLTQVTE